ncbi:MAG: S41 family peptidase [Arenimonas sp.]
MRLRRCLLATLAILGCAGTPPAAGSELSLAARRADFETLWQAVAEDYVYLDGKRPWWATARERYARRVAAANTADAWATAVEDALDELHDFHVGVRPGSARRWLPVPTAADLWAVPDGGAALITAVREGSDAARAGLGVDDRIEAIGGDPVATAIDRRLGRAVNLADSDARQWALLSLVTGRRGEARAFVVSRAGAARRLVTLPAVRRFDRPAEPVSWSRLPGGIGIIRINNSLGRQETVSAFDAALASLRDTRALILDLRDTPSGGNSGVALGILGRFVTARAPYQRHRIPRYGQPDVERNWQEEVASRGPFAYEGRLVVLVDHWTGSMAEGMAIGVDGMHRGTVIGTTMGQLAGAGEDVKLPRTGLTVTLPGEELFHVDGTPRHRWVPPVVVDPTGAPGDADPILARARKILDEPPGIAR